MSEAGDFPGVPLPHLLKKGMAEIRGFQSANLGTPKAPWKGFRGIPNGEEEKVGVLGWTLSCPQTTRFYLHDVLEFKSDVISTKTLMTSQESVESLD